MSAPKLSSYGARGSVKSEGVCRPPFPEGRLAAMEHPDQETRASHLAAPAPATPDLVVAPHFPLTTSGVNRRTLAIGSRRVRVQVEIAAGIRKELAGTRGSTRQMSLGGGYSQTSKANLYTCL